MKDELFNNFLQTGSSEETNMINYYKPILIISFIQKKI